MGRNHALKPQFALPAPTHSSSPFHYLKNASPSDFLQTSSLSALSVGGRIPGFKISAAFLSSLHTNIFIEVDSTYGSPISTPHDLGTEFEILPSPYTSSVSSISPVESVFSDDADAKRGSIYDSNLKRATSGTGASALEYLAANDEDAHAEALHIIAESVAQQRDLATRSAISHPVILALMAIAIGVLGRAIHNSTEKDWTKIFMTAAGIVMTVLGAVRLLCGPYILEAENVGTWHWLDRGRSAEEEDNTGLRVLGQQDDVLVAKLGGDFVGAIVFRGVQPLRSNVPGGARKTRRTPSSSKQTRTVIRGWTVKPKYRMKGIGTGLLENALRSARARGWTVDGIEFAEDHANHKRVLPALLNGALDTLVSVAHVTLDKQIQELGLVNNKGRRRK